MQVLHVVATRERRGAEIFASDLVNALNAHALTQSVAVLHGSARGAVYYPAPAVVLGSNGWKMPAVRVEPTTLIALREQIRRRKPKIVQAHGGEALKYSIPAALGFGSQVVYRRIGAVPPWTSGGFGRIGYGALARRAARVVAVAEAIRRETIEVLGVPRCQVVVIPNGVDPQRLRPERTRAAIRRSLGIPSTARVVISVGALTWEKDPLGHLKVVRGVLRRDPNAVHVLVGDGPLRGEVSRAVDGLSLNGKVLVLGTRSDIADLLSASDVMLLASRTEGMPACLIEAGMAGLPVVAYAVGGVSEVVVDGETGLLASPGDEESLTRRVLELMNDKHSRGVMGNAAQKRCRALFDIEAVAQRYLSLYEEVAGS